MRKKTRSKPSPKSPPKARATPKAKARATAAAAETTGPAAGPTPAGPPAVGAAPPGGGAGNATRLLRGRRRPKGIEPRTAKVGVACTDAWYNWVYDLADHTGMTLPNVIAAAAQEFARARGMPGEMPAR